jgi:hypothetical protein
LVVVVSFPSESLVVVVTVSLWETGATPDAAELPAHTASAACSVTVTMRLAASTMDVNAVHFDTFARKFVRIIDASNRPGDRSGPSRSGPETTPERALVRDAGVRAAPRRQEQSNAKGGPSHHAEAARAVRRSR